MSEYDEEFKKESDYLEGVMEFLASEIDKKNIDLTNMERELYNIKKGMWNDMPHVSTDYMKLSEVNQYNMDINNKTAAYNNLLIKVNKYKSMLYSPYFGRFDFEDDTGDKEKVYVGLHNVMDTNTYTILVYDWRAPICSIFYRYECGGASYDSPAGKVTGDVSLKRQYKIEKSRLKYFFNCNVKIDDEILQEVLYKNSSTKMKNIVETIQKEQDIVIRDTQNKLLIVQGAAGSGKTSIAMHRIAYLLYQGMQNGMNYKNFVIVSPNSVFGKYISSILPELGEQNVKQIVFEDYAIKTLKSKGTVETRNAQIEYLMKCNGADFDTANESIDFKASDTFHEILKRFLKYYERHIIEFSDVYYDGKMVESRENLKSMFLNNKINIPAEKRLKRIEGRIFEELHPMQREKYKKLIPVVQKMDGHDTDFKVFARFLSILRSKPVNDNIEKFSNIDYYEAYKMLFEKKGLLMRLSKGLKLPKNIDGIIKSTVENLSQDYIRYEDSAPIIYLKLKLEGTPAVSGVKQVVIDEAQDYTSIQYEIFNMLYKDAYFTILGDINQCIEKQNSLSIYDNMVKVFNKDKSVILTLKRTYRSSYEINKFCGRILGKPQYVIPFERHEKEPEVICKESTDEMYAEAAKCAEKFLSEGFGTAAIICKTSAESEMLYEKLKGTTRVKLIDSNSSEIDSGIMILPSYMTKGLEFDTVIVLGADENNYSTDLDRRLLYISCTRALHRLNIYYVGRKSKFME